MKTCSVEGCQLPKSGLGMCLAHYARYKRHGDAQAHIPIGGDRMIKLCSTGCGKRVLARGWCATHYQRWFINGDAGEVDLRRVPSDPDATEKRCITCKVTKPVDDFYSDKRTRDRRQSECKPCFGLRQTNMHRRRKYGITTADYTAMVETQGGRCQICDEEAKLVIDHCHRGGQVRALLCDRCNRLLGVVDDSQDLLVRAVEFLKQHQ